MVIVEEHLCFLIQLDRFHPRCHQVACDHAGRAIEAHPRKHGHESRNGDCRGNSDDADDDHHLHQGKTGLGLPCFLVHAEFLSRVYFLVTVHR